MKKLYLLIVAVFLTTFGYSATISTVPNVRICNNSYTGIGNIVISEAAVGDFVVGTNYYLFIVAPTGFEFNPAAGVAIGVGAPNNVANQSILFKTSSVICVKYDITAITQTDVITISNIEMKALLISGATGNVTVGTGSYLGGIAVGTTMATVSSALTALSFTPPTTRCSNNLILSLIGTAADAPGTGVGASSGFSGTGVTGTNFHPGVAGVGPHTLTYTVNTTTPTCVYTQTASISVVTPPTVSIAADETNGIINDNNVCFTKSITFTGYGATTYQFQDASVNTTTTNPWTTTSLALAGHSIRVIGTTGGCSDTSSAIPVTVYGNPAIPTFAPTATSYSVNDPAFRLDLLTPVVSPAPTANSYFSKTGNGIGDRVWFIPSIAGAATHTITYNYVDGNGCESSSTPVNFNVTGGSVPPYSIAGLNAGYCPYDPIDGMSVQQIYIDYGFGLIVQGGSYQFQFFDGTNWVNLATTQTGASPPYTYTAVFNPVTLSSIANGGTGTKPIRYTFTYNIFGSLIPGIVGDVVNPIINARPTIAITNNFSNPYWSCQSQGPELLTYSSSAAGTAVFSSTTTNFVQINAGSYFVHRSAPAVPPSGSCYVVDLLFTDNATGCNNTTNASVCIDQTPAAPTVVTPSAFCKGDFVSNLQMNAATRGYVNWFRKGATGTALGAYNVTAIGGGPAYFSPGVLVQNDTFVVNQTNIYNTCTGPLSGNLVVTMNNPATVDAGIYPNVCSSNPTLTLAGTRNPGALGITWTRADDGNFGAPGINAPNPTYTAGPTEIANGYMKLYLTTADPDGVGVGCSAVQDSAFVYINGAAVISAGADVSFCSNTLVSLSGVYGVNTTSSTWYKNTVGGIQTGISTPLGAFSTYTPTLGERNGGPIVFVIESNDPDGAGPCLPVNDQVTITISPEAVVNAGVTSVSCGLAGINLVGTCNRFGSAVPLGATWTGGVGGAAAFAPSNTSLTSTYSPTGPEAVAGGSILFTLTSADPDGGGPTGPCTAMASSVFKTINPAPFVNVGADATWCSNTTPTVTALLTGSATNLTWTKSSGSGIILSPTSPITDYIVNPGDYALGTPLDIDFTATTNDPDGAGPCVAAVDVVRVTLNPHLTVDAGTDILVCAGQPINTAGNVKIGGIDRLTAAVNNWSVLVGAGSTTQNGPSNFTGSYLPSGNMLTNTGELGLGGSIILQLTSADPDGAGPCTVASDLVRVNINQRARVSAGADTVFCANDAMILNGSMLTASTDFVTWTGRPLTSFNSAYIVNPKYTPIAPSELHGNSYNAATGTILPNQITFTITGNDPDGVGPCPSESDDVLVSINPMVTVNAGTDMAFCGHALQQAIPAMAALVNTANIKLGNTDRLTTAPAVNAWTIVSGTGTPSGINFASSFNINYTPSGSLADSGLVANNGSLEFGNLSTITLQLSTTDPDGAGPCLAASDQVSLTIYPRPIPHFVGFETEYCRNTDDVRYLEGNIFSTVSNGAVFSIVGGANASISTSGDNYVFSPSDASINNNGATFDVKYRQSKKWDATNTCYNYVDTTVRVFPIPQVNFTASSRCQGDTITFAETASINSSVFASTEIDWDWYIDNDTIDNSVTPNISSLNRASTLYSFLNYGNHTIKLVTTTNSGGTLNCSNEIDTTLVFGPYPNTNYTWLNPCSVDSVAFTNTTNIAPGYSNSISWNFAGAGALKNGSTITTPNPYYQYSQPGIYNAQLIATTNTYNCVKIKTKEVFVVPTYSITGSDPYDSSFTTNLNWAPSSAFADSSYSWTHGTPVGKQVINPGGNVWITNLTGGYRIGERSYLNSPCFNMQALDKPMMVMKAWSNSRNLAGTVLEASVGNTNTWTTIGQIGDGLNWYDTQGIVGLIGASASNPIAQGFSGEDTNWEISRIGLSQYANQSNLVKFRLVFGSSNVNDPLNVRDGIALDSIWIGNRSKVVLAEHFTNSLCPSCIEANDTVNSIQSVRPVDMVSVHYHTSFPGADNMNASNPSDPSSKVLFYGVSNTPRSFIDGTQMFSEYGNTPAALSRSSIDTKALENAKFKLDLSTTKSGLNLNVKTQIIATEPLNQDIVLNVAVLEDYVSGGLAGGNQSGYRWVLKKMLPDAAGSYISKNWAVNDTVKTNQDWTFTLSNFYDTSKIVVVAFVQNYSTKEVYQAIKVSSNGNTSTPIITSVEPQDLASNLLIYPVPADDEVNVLFANDIAEDTEYSLTDDLGKVVEKGIIEQGVRMLSFNTKKYAAGMYYLSIPKPDGTKVIRKIVVIH